MDKNLLWKNDRRKKQRTNQHDMEKANFLTIFREIFSGFKFVMTP